MHTIEAVIDTATLAAVGDLYPGTLKELISEGLQNARRPGARRVIITARTTEHPEMVTRMTMRDDGTGLDDPSMLLRYGASAWDERVGSQEKPAGMGMLSFSQWPIRIASMHGGHIRANERTASGRPRGKIRESN